MSGGSREAEGPRAPRGIDPELLHASGGAESAGALRALHQREPGVSGAFSSSPALGMRLSGISFTDVACGTAARVIANDGNLFPTPARQNLVSGDAGDSRPISRLASTPAGRGRGARSPGRASRPE